MTRPRASRRQHAFSLLELILALAMVAILAGALYMSITIAARARDSTAAAVAPVRSVLLAADLVRQDLESVLPPTGQFAGEFVGTPQNGADELAFSCLGNDLGWNLSAVPPTPAEAQQIQPPWSDGIRHVQLFLRTDVNPPALVRRVTRNLLPPSATDPEEEILCRNVRSFTLRYFDGSAWQDQWDSTGLGNVLPLAVEMTMEALIDTKPGQPPRPYKVVRVFPLACATPGEDAQ